MKIIQLRYDKQTIVDDEDYDWLMSLGRWIYLPNGDRQGYALLVQSKKWDKTIHGYKKVKPLRMHRLIINAPQGIMVDHEDGDSLNNTRKNLRLATRQQNMRNASKPKRSKGSYSQYKGVIRNEYYGKYKKYPPEKQRPFAAIINEKGKIKHIGTFFTEEDAARAYDAAAIRLYGEFAYLNFPDSSI